MLRLVAGMLGLAQAGPSRPLGPSTTARHTAPRRGLGPLLPSRSQPLRRPPTRHVPASPAPRDLLPLAWPIFRPARSTSLVQPAREWHDAVYWRALPRQWPRHAGSASSRYHVAQRPGLSRGAKRRRFEPRVSQQRSGLGRIPPASAQAWGHRTSPGGQRHSTFPSSSVCRHTRTR